ncbi:methyl-accepting chemotaxis protein [Prodigiosinella confusarubida]|uniref:Methyl-accepting chemotaxis protein n=1 Tax=Serratia sp. (strain ATCC 39006) TaxID=104623 RepID=A0A2I5T4L4_SERS3|nr:methyl-accepting chemotaxis protein [Serratia sp. ATCC 39006]AUG99508.1 methyl-accepting chemotaxis protein [Serratia sp. ATCC 39006]AUH03826.1 methyl-accepting chemotaxis protein [Serratia sp. ATCC 39006]
MHLSNWRIGYRLSAGFTFLVMMLFIVSMISIKKLSDFHDSALDIVTVLYPQTVDSNELISDVNSGVQVFQQLMLLSEQEKIKSTVDSIADISKNISQLMDKLENSANNSHDTQSLQMLKNIRRIRADFLTSGQTISSQILAGNREAALNEFNSHLYPVQSEYRKAVHQLVDHQDDMMSATVDVMAKIYSETRWVLLGIFAICAALGAWIAWSMTHSVTRPIHQALEVADKVSQGDLTSTIVAVHKDETGMLLQSLDHMNASLRQIVGQVRDGAETISTAASQIAAGNQDLSARTEEQASSLEQTASSMEELTSTIKNTADNTHQATEISNKASSAAQRSSEVMHSVTQKMRGIRDSSQRMAEIIGVIDGIAFQTNILALNAAVEAARAGEQGRGFAVVAGEVRSLAQRSATAAKEIKELIDDSVDNIQDGMQLVDTAEETMNGLAAHVQDVNHIISEISQASREQSDGINQINIAVGQIDTTTQQNAALVEESASAALSLQSQAAMLAEAVSAFKLHISQAESERFQYASQQSPMLTPALPAGRISTMSKGKDTAASSAGEWTSF